MSFASLMFSLDQRWAMDAPEVARTEDDAEITVRADEIRPCDYLPPQPELDATAWQDSGFRVGPRKRDVCRDAPRAPGRVLLFGPNGVLDSLSSQTEVLVVRRR